MLVAPAGRQGAFVCNEYKDVFLARYDGPAGALVYAPDEVTFRAVTVTSAVTKRHGRD